MTASCDNQLGIILHTASTLIGGREGMDGNQTFG